MILRPTIFGRRPSRISIEIETRSSNLKATIVVPKSPPILKLIRIPSIGPESMKVVSIYSPSHTHRYIYRKTSVPAIRKVSMGRIRKNTHRPMLRQAKGNFTRKLTQFLMFRRITIFPLNLIGSQQINTSSITIRRISTLQT